MKDIVAAMTVLGIVAVTARPDELVRPRRRREPVRVGRMSNALRASTPTKEQEQARMSSAEAKRLRRRERNKRNEEVKL